MSRILHFSLEHLLRSASLMLVLCLLFGVKSGIAQPMADEEAIKAAFLYNFAEYVTWPSEAFATADDPIVFAFIDADEVAGYLEQITPVTSINGRLIDVQSITWEQGVTGVHVLYVGNPILEVDRVYLLEALSQSVLTVTESSSIPEASVINFRVVDDRVRFDISLTAANLGGLQISSRLLQLALSLTGTNP